MPSEEFKKYLENMEKEVQKKKEKNSKDRTKIEEKIFEFKVKKLNNLLEAEGINFRFNIRKVADHYEFDVPMKVLFGPKTRKFCAEKWGEVMEKADIDMDFTDEIDRLIKEMSGIVLTMKMNLSMTKEIGQGEITDESED
jgi:hypothetical protein